MDKERTYRAGPIDTIQDTVLSHTLLLIAGSR